MQLLWWIFSCLGSSGLEGTLQWLLRCDRDSVCHPSCTVGWKKSQMVPYQAAPLTRLEARWCCLSETTTEPNPIAADLSQPSHSQPLGFTVPLATHIGCCPIIFAFTASYSNLLCIYSLLFPDPKSQEIEISNNQRHAVDFNKHFLNEMNCLGAGTRTESPISRNLLYWDPSTCLQILLNYFYICSLEKIRLCMSTLYNLLVIVKICPTKAIYRKNDLLGSEFEGTLHHGREGMGAKL